MNISTERREAFWINRVKSTQHNKLRTTGINGERRAITKTLQMEHESISKLASNNQQLEYIIYLTIYGIILNKYFHEDDILICANSPATPGEEATLQLFNIKIDRSLTVGQLLKNCRNEYQLCKSHELSYSQMHEISRQYGRENGSINQYIFNFGSLQSCQSEFLICLGVTKLPDSSLELVVSYVESIFQADFITQLLEHYSGLVSTITSILTISVSKLDILKHDERQRIIYEFNQTLSDYPKATVIELFEKQARATPDAIALSDSVKDLTYRELSSVVGSLSSFLNKDCNVKRGDRIGVLLDRNNDYIVSILAILKVGGVYVPIDPSYPKERISFIIEDVEPVAIITHSDYLFDITSYQGKLFAIDIQLDMLNGEPEEIDVSYQPTDLAYIMYTSGSTGSPKGVMVSNKSIVRLIKNTNYIIFSPVDKVLLTGALSFDATTFEIWGPLLNGGELHIISKESLINISHLKHEIRSRLITIMWMTSSWFNQIIEENPSLFAVLSVLVIGGDKLSPKHTNVLRDFYPDLKLINGYGPTENTTFSLCHHIQEKYETSIPLGKPISNSTVYILNEDLQPVPIGVEGEIFVGGDGVSIGYWNKPELTRSKFVTDPFIKGPNQLFRTGDYGKWTFGGEVEFLGRKDSQVKVRGHRIELGEIEETLTKHNSIGRVAVLLKENDQADKLLMAYYIEDREVSDKELIAFLTTRLPNYMIPSVFVRLKRFPLTTNGKIDTAALPDPQESTEADEVYQIAENEIETKLVEIWVDILGVKRIGVNDNFFGLGGHSLLVVKMFARVYKEFGAQPDINRFFENPTIRQMAPVIENQDESRLGKIPIISDQPYYELSHAQRRLWLLQQIENRSKTYNMPFVFWVRGDLEIEKFQMAWQHLIDRHEILRTNFIVQDGTPKQVIKGKGENNCKLQVVGIQSHENPHRYLEELINYEVNVNFDLEADHLVRVKLVQTQNKEFILLLTLHHIIFDGWSLGVLVKDIAKSYNNLKNGTTYTEDLPFQYRDYAVWQNKRLTDEKLNSLHSYWMSQFEQIPPPLTLPADYTRPTIKSFIGNSKNFILDPELSKKLSAFSQANNVTLFTTLFTAVSALLYRYTNQKDIVIGTPVAGRDHADLVDQIGFYVNTLPIRACIDDRDSFVLLLERLRETILEAFKHQLYPFDKLVEELKISRDIGRTPLFDIVVQQLNMDLGLQYAREIEGVKVDSYERNIGISKYDLTFTFREVVNQVHLNIEYNTDLFAELRINRLFDHLVQLLNNVMGDPTLAITKITIVGEEEKLLLKQFERSPSHFDPRDGLSLIEQFYKQVNENKEAKAVVVDGEALTYSDLNIRSNQLAYYLEQEYGVSKQLPVGVLMDRSESIVITLLALMKLGAFYVPLDLRNGDNRTAHITREANLQLIIHDDPDRIPANERGCELNISTALAASSNFDTQDIPNVCSGDDLAYIVYTSGSTGTPKGVMIQHHALINLCEWHINQFNLLPTSRTTLGASVAFDAFGWELWPTLLSGGMLFLLKDTEKLDLAELVFFLKNNEITHSFLPTALCEQLALLEESRLLTDITILTGGEALKLNRKPDFKLINNYGPTEGAVVSTFFSLSDWDGFGAIPIGKPIANVEIYILGPGNVRQPIGMAGEICISGCNLAKGYLKDEALTSKSFISNPFDPNKRLYKTGDFGAWDESGNIVFYGRRDHQVNIRGKRVELGEIESVLSKFDGIKHAVVRLHHTGQLVAFYIGEPGCNIPKVDLQKWLPDFMIPTHFVHLEQFPLTVNDKIDDKLLGSYELQPASAPVDFTTETEVILGRLWCKLIGISKICRTDDFFEIGGHSLLAFRLMNDIHRECGVKISLAAIFTHTSLKDLAFLIDHSKKDDYQLIHPADKQESYEMSNAQQRLWILYQLNRNSHAFNIPGVYCLEGLNYNAFERSLQTLISRHEIFRTTFSEDNGELIQKVNYTETVPIAYHDLRERCLSESELQGLIETDLQHQFDLENEMPIVFRIRRLEESKYLFVCILHHIVADEWSVEVLIRDLIKLYNSFLHGEKNPLPPLHIQYKDYAQWHNRQVLAANFQKHRAFWLKIFNREIPILNLPTQFVRPARTTSNGNTITCSSDKYLKNKLDEFCRNNGVSPFMVLLAGYKVLLFRYSAQTDLIVGATVSGREHSQLHDQIGYYSNTIAFRTQIKNEDTFDKYLKRVRKTVLDSFGHQEYPFNLILDELTLDRTQSRYPLFNVMFGYHNLDKESEILEDMEGVTVSPVVLTNRTSKVDLTLTIDTHREGLHVHVNYNTDLFIEGFINNFIEHYLRVLNQVFSTPSGRISAINIITDHEKREIDIFNDTYSGYPVNSIVDCFEEQVNLDQDKIAVVFQSTSINYGELFRKVNGLAQELIEQGVKRGDCCMVIIDHSLELIVSLMAVMKVGATFVPVDVQWPEQRIYIIRETVSASLVLYAATQVGERIQGIQKLIVSYDNIVERDTPLRIVIDTEDTLCIIFTSGSTGTPKGVELSHKGIMNRLHWMNEYFGKPTAASVLQTTRYVYDSMLWQLFWPIINGGKTIILPPLFDITADSVCQLIADHEVKIVDFVPSIFNFIGAETHAQSQVFRKQLQSLDYIILGGEEISSESTFRFMEDIPFIKIVNLYGPTEASIGCVYYEVPKERTATIPIGKPISNVNVFVLNECGLEMPIGVPGELCISGVCLAKGYVNDPARTKQVFGYVGNGSEQRIYKTGDLAKWLPDGNLEFLGRKDNQVKIRGHRIELGEIEKALIQIPKVVDAAVLVKELDGVKALCAYLVIPSHTDVDVNNIRQNLLKSLPQYMIPASFIRLDKLPVTTGGKLDIKSLPEPENNSRSRDFVQSTSSSENSIWNIWKNVLEKDNLSIHDNFFDVGGNSLKAIKVINKIKTELNVPFQLADFFNAATIFLLAKKVSENSQATVVNDKIEKAGEKDHYELTHGQRRLWILQQFEDLGASYNISLVSRMEGKVDLKVLEEAFRILISRHEILRTTFIQTEGNVFQKVHSIENINIPFRINKIFGATKDHINELIADGVAFTFDLEQPPLIYASVLVLEDEKLISVLNMHHIISDGWSVDLIREELVTIYEQLKNNEEVKTDSFALQYKDYAEWQNQQIRRGAYKSDKDYWLAKLHTPLPELNFYKRNPLFCHSHEGKTVIINLAPKTVQNIRQLQKKHQVTLFVVLLSLTKALFYRYTGSADILVGTPVSGRGREELEDILGFFVNTTVLRTEFDKEITFGQLVQLVKNTVLESYAHQNYPFDTLVEDLELDLTAGQNPIFDIMFTLVQYEELSLMDDIRLFSVEYDNKKSKFDLTITFAEQNETISARLEYKSACFSDDNIIRLMSHFERVVDQIATFEDIGLRDFVYISHEEELLVLDEFNDTCCPYPYEKLIHELFEEQTLLDGSKLAIVDEEMQLTYQQLDELSTNLATCLQNEYGIANGERVAIIAVRSALTVVGILAILKAGAAYVPIDPELPEARASYIIRDTNSKIILTCKGATAFSLDKVVLPIEAGMRRSSGQTLVPNFVGSHQQQAYVMYTSGTSGQPKGVLVSHRNVVRLVKNVNYIVLKAGQRLLATGSLSFDASTFELWSMLLNGGTVYMPSKENMANSKFIKDYVSSNKIDIAWFTSSWFNQIVDFDETIFDPLEYVLVGGDKLSGKHVNKLRIHNDTIKIINGYGPTENTTFSACYEIKEVIQDDIPIGTPINNSSIYILDHAMKPVAIGMTGEIFVGGDGVALGYLNDCELTEKRFVDVPMPQGGVRHLYRTGDLGEWLEDGNIQFVGRKDDQVKIRGYRVETAEIQKVLSRHDKVNEVIVLSQRDGNGESVIVAFYISDDFIQKSDFEQYLKTILPSYMMPSYYVHFDKFPLNKNAKVDTTLLAKYPVFNEEAKSEDKAIRQPINNREATLLAIWQDLFSKENISVSDNFFEIGGHSLKATQLMSRIYKELKVDIGLSTIFVNPTIRMLASHMHITETTTPREITKVQNSDYYDLSFAQRRLWLINQLEDGQSNAYNIPLALLVEGLDVNILQKVLDYIIERHEGLRTVFVNHGGIPKQKIVAVDDFPPVLEVVSLATSDLGEVRVLAKQEGDGFFDLSKGPLVRVKAFCLSNGLSVVTLTMHHIVADGWSLEIILKEFKLLYNSFISKQEVPIQSLGIQYKDFAAWQIALIRNSSDENFWMRKLQGRVSFVNLPYDFPKADNNAFEGSSVGLSLSQAVRDQIHAFANSIDATVSTVLFTTFNILLYQLTGQQEISTAISIANRNHADIEGIVGFFANLLVINVDFTEDHTIDEMVRKVHSEMLLAFDHQNYPFDLLVEKLNPERQANYQPLINVVYTFLSRNATGSDVIDSIKLPKNDGYKILDQDFVDNRNRSIFDLLFLVADSHDSIDMSLQYNSHLFRRETVANYLQYFENIISSVVHQYQLNQSSK